MTTPLHQQDQWNQIMDKYNQLLVESQQLAGTDEYRSVQKFLAAQELAQWMNKTQLN